MKELESKLNNAVTDILDLTKYSMEQCNCPITDCFPASAYRTVEIDGHVYQVCTEITMKKLK